jgi:hypothetical protein
VAVAVAILQEIELVETLAVCVFRSIEIELLDSLEGFIWKYMQSHRRYESKKEGRDGQSHKKPRTAGQPCAAPWVILALRLLHGFWQT